MCVAISNLHTNAWASRPRHASAAHTRERTRATTGAPVATAKTLHAKEDSPIGTEARPGSLRTSSTAIPCDLPPARRSHRRRPRHFARPAQEVRLSSGQRTRQISSRPPSATCSAWARLVLAREATSCHVAEANFFFHAVRESALLVREHHAVGTTRSGSLGERSGRTVRRTMSARIES